MTHHGPGRLLVVDDERHLMDVLCEMLPEHGYETVGFTSSPEALEELRERDFDVLLSDLMMPDMDGVTLLSTALEIDPGQISRVDVVGSQPDVFYDGDAGDQQSCRRSAYRS